MSHSNLQILKEFFDEHLKFTPTPNQLSVYQSDLSLVSPLIMRAALKEATKGSALKGRPAGEYREIIFTIYNRKVAEHAQLFPIFHSFETAFRSTVTVEMENYYGMQYWWDDIYRALRRGETAKTVTNIGKRRISKDTAHLIGEIIYSIEGESFQRQVISNLQDGYGLTEFCNLSHIGKDMCTTVRCRNI